VFAKIKSIIGILTPSVVILWKEQNYVCINERLVKSDRSTILVNLCIALILSYTLFLIGVNRTENKVTKGVVIIS
jgi:hypothetical protein